MDREEKVYRECSICKDTCVINENENKPFEKFTCGTCKILEPKANEKPSYTVEVIDGYNKGDFGGHTVWYSEKLIKKVIDELTPTQIDCMEAESYFDALKHVLEELGIIKNE